MVQPHDLSASIKEHPFFSGMEDKYLQLIAGCAKNEVFHAGDTIFKEGEEAAKFYVIRSGQVALEVYAPGRQPMVVETLGEGEVLGWSWITEKHMATNDARAVTLCRAISLDAVCLRKKMNEDHSLGYELYRRFIPIIADRLAHTRLRLIDMYGTAE